MSETLGDLIDKLSIANLKIWHLQEKVYRFSGMTSEEYAAVPSDEAHAVWKKLAKTNLVRTDLISQIDGVFAEALRTGEAPQDAKVKITD